MLLLVTACGGSPSSQGSGAGASSGASESTEGEPSTSTEPTAGPSSTTSGADADATSGTGSSSGETAEDGWIVRGRFESAGPVPGCGGIASWSSPDGPLLRFSMDLCGDDIAALASTVVANLDAVAKLDQRALVIFNQGINLPPSWLAECETYALDSGSFVGDLCLPWDDAYQQHLGDALADHLGPAVSGHPALEGVYFTISTMTNGAEMHFRVQRDEFPYPGDAVFRQAYLDVMDLYQGAFTAPIVFEAGHCIWMGPQIDCETPRALYEHSRSTYGVDWSGIALWNCAERFWVSEANEEVVETRALIEQATSDGASIGCQTVGSFTNGACRFTHDEVGDYGPPPGPMQGDDCAPDPAFDPEGACVDTMRWFAGAEAQAELTASVVGTWAENWTIDYTPQGIINTSAACREAVDLLGL